MAGFSIPGFLFRWARSLPILASFLLYIGSLYSGSALAEVRVVVEYDHFEHRLVRVVDVPSTQPASLLEHLAEKSKPVITPTDAVSKVKLLWFSADGELISTALMDDPRLTHAPLTGTDQMPTVVGLDSGAFMVSGPSNSALLEIHMPQNATLGLDQQLWRMSLDR